MVDVSMLVTLLVALFKNIRQGKIEIKFGYHVLHSLVDHFTYRVIETDKKVNKNLLNFYLN